MSRQESLVLPDTGETRNTVGTYNHNSSTTFTRIKSPIKAYPVNEARQIASPTKTKLYETTITERTGSLNDT